MKNPWKRKFKASVTSSWCLSSIFVIRFQIYEIERMPIFFIQYTYKFSSGLAPRIFQKRCLKQQQIGDIFAAILLSFKVSYLFFVKSGIVRKP